MKKTLLMLGIFIMLLNGCAAPSAQQPTEQQPTSTPVIQEATGTPDKATTVVTLVPSPTVTVSPTASPMPTATPPGISAENYSNFAVTTQYLVSLQKAVAGLEDSVSLDAIAGSPDGRYVAIGGCSESYQFSCPNSVLGKHSFIVILDAVTSEVISILPENETTITGMGFSSDSSQLIYATYPQRVTIWDISTQKITKTIFNNDQPITKIRMQVNPDGQTIAVSSKTGLMIFEYGSGKLINEIPGAGYTPYYNADGSRLAMFSNTDGSEISVYDTANWQEISRIQYPDQSASGSTMDFSPDGAWIVTKPVSDNPVIRVWNANTGEQVKILEAPTGEILSITFAPNNQLLFISVYSDLELIGKITVWDVGTWQQLGVLNNYSWNSNLSFNRTGEFMLASNGKDIWRWSLLDGQIINSREAVVKFFNALSRGDYSAAAALYQPDQYEIENLKSIGLDTSDLASLLEEICNGNTRICLPVMQVLPGGGLSQYDEYEVFVQFQSPDGSAFVNSYGITDQYVFLGMDTEQNWKVHFIPYNE